VMKASSSRTIEFGKMFTAAVMNDGPIFVASIVGCQSGHMAQRCYCWSFSEFSPSTYIELNFRLLFYSKSPSYIF
jgi:hypothetical protein